MEKLSSDDMLYFLIDLLMSEYGWSLEYALKLPNDVAIKLVTTILKRKKTESKTWTKLIGCAVAAGFSGKLDLLDNVFKEGTQSPEPTEEDKTAWHAQMRGLWKRLGRDVADFDKKWASGEQINF